VSGRPGFGALGDDDTPSCGGRAVTADQRAAIEARLKRFPEVERVFHETSAQAYENAVAMGLPVGDTSIAHMPESFRVKLKDPSTFSDNLAALRGTPGISLVTAVEQPTGRGGNAQRVAGPEPMATTRAQSGGRLGA
jgi:hypothetical protein